MNKLLFIIYLFLLCPILGIGQQKTTISKGLVVDTDNHSVRAASVRSLKTGNETATDKDGRFTLAVALPDTLTISRMGYVLQQFIVTNVESRIRIILQSGEQQIEEVLVHTGYQSLKPNEVNGSVTVINKEMLQMQNGTNILQRLNGVTNGLSFNVGKNNSNPQNKTNIMVRGHSTINGPLDPLIVLDNFVYEGDIDNINPDDIESVTILKDASATSIYGARGGNGVIVITSKRGRFNQSVQVDVRASTMITAIPDLSPLRTMDNKDYIAVERMLYERGNFNADINRSNRQMLTPVVDILNRKAKGALTEEEAERFIKMYENGDFLQQYSDAFFQKGHTDQYHVGLRGGSDRHNWNLSANLNKGKDPIGDQADRINLGLSNTMKVVDWMSVGIDAQINDRKSINRTVPTVTELRSFTGRAPVPYVLLFDESGAEIPFLRYNSLYLDTVGRGRLLDWYYYPVRERELATNSSKSRELLGLFYTELRPFAGLQLTGSYQYQRQESVGKMFYDQDSYYMRDMINRFAQINQTTGVVTYPVPLGDRLSFSNRWLSSQQFRLQSSYAKNWREHRVHAMAGFEVRETKTTGNGMIYYGYNQDPLLRTTVDLVTRFRTRPTGNAYIVGAPSMTADLVNRFVSLYGNAFYSYKDRYSVTASMRRDGSNIYGASTNDKWTPLWSVGLGYELSKESFFKSDFVDYLKLRATLGYSGNVDLSRSALPVASYWTGDAALGSLPVAGIAIPSNPSLRWEQVRQLNMGLDFRAWQGRFSGSLEYYLKESTDLYGPGAYDYTTLGRQATVVMNTADLEGRGVDVQLRVVPLQKDLIWSSALIVNYNQSKVTRYHLDRTDFRNPIDQILDRSGDRIYPIEGRPLYNIAAFRWAGLDAQGDPMGYLNGALSKEYLKLREEVRLQGDATGTARYVGSAIPTFTGGWLNELSYRNVSLSWNLTYRTGYYFRRQTILFDALISGGAGHPDYALRWQQPGDEVKTDVPAFIYPNAVSGRDAFTASAEHLVEKADHIRLQFVNLSYQFKSKLKYMPKSTRVFLNASDLGIIWRANKHGLDPDYPYSIRPSQTYSIGINAQF